MSFAGILLLTLHTSHVRGRWVRITLVVCVLVIVDQHRAGDRRHRGVHRRDLHLDRVHRRVTADHPQPDLPAPGGRSRDDPGRDLLVPPHRDRVRRDLRDAAERRLRELLRAAWPARAHRLPLLQLHRAHDDRLRRPHPGDVGRQGDRDDRGPDRPGVPRDDRRVAGVELRGHPSPAHRGRHRLRGGRRTNG